MTTLTTALARLTGARANHMDPAVAVMVENALRRHRTDCGLHHVLGLDACKGYDDALRVLGMSS